jgi:hypothetical protein
LVGVTLAGIYQAFPYLEPFDKDDWDAWANLAHCEWRRRRRQIQHSFVQLKHTIEKMILIPSANVFLCKAFEERSRSTVPRSCTCRRRRRVRVLPKDLVRRLEARNCHCVRRDW